MSDTSWRELALQFDAQRMQALAHIRALLADPVKHADAASAFLAAPPIPGEKVLAERLAENAETEKQLRRMLCVAYAGPTAYMDDGEASDSRCLPSIDFLRDTPDEIQHKMHQRSLTRMQEADQSSPIEWYPGITEKHFELAITRATATLTAERDRLKDALDEWLDKTYWVQTTATVSELGKHRADVLRARIEALTESKSVVATGKHAELPVLLNGLTAEETATTASCLGLIARPAGAQQPGACGNTPYDEGPFTLEQRSVTAGVTGPRDVVSIQRQAFIRGWDERGMMHQLRGTVETDEHMRALLDIYFPRTAAPTIQPAPASQRGALDAFENKERGTPQAHIAAAVVESGYSGDPDTKGTLIVRALDLSECKVGDYLYAASTRPALNDAPDNCKIQDTNQQAWDAELGRTAMQFVDRAGDVHPGIDDAETICAEFYKAMMAVIERMPHVQRMSKP